MGITALCVELAEILINMNRFDLRLAGFHNSFLVWILVKEVNAFKCTYVFFLKEATSAKFQLAAFLVRYGQRFKHA